MNRIFLSAAGPALATAALVFVAGCFSSSSAQTRQAPAAANATSTAVRVAAAPPVRKTLRLESVQPGTIEAFEHTSLFAKLAAYVEKLHVDIGDRVEANQLLAELSLPELQEELRQKDAAVVQAQAEIELATAAIQAAEAAVPTAQAKISEAEAEIARTEADCARWRSQYARIGQLAASGSIDRKIEDETLNSQRAAEAARKAAQAKLTSAKAALVECQAGVAKAKAGQSVARARHQNAEADLARQKTLFQYTQIRAPYAGIVTERNVNRGDFVQPAGTATNKPLLAVASTDTVRIFVDVPEMASPWIEAGRPALVNVQALPDQTIEGKVTRTAWTLGANRTLRTELDLSNPNALLRPGMYATARVLLQERRDVYVLPTAAVAREGKLAFCWIAQDGLAKRIPISVGLQVGNEVEVAAGVKGDELIVQVQSGALKEGQAVELVESKTN